MSTATNGSTKDEHFVGIKALQKKGVTYDELMDIYDNCASKEYDQSLQAVGYMAPQFVSEYFDKHARALGIPKDALILDVAAGTGLQGVILKKKYGYTRLDATDASQAMLDKARDTGVYRNFYCCRIGGGYKLPMADNTYDSAVMAGGLAEGHIKCDAFLELIRVVKPGGLIVNAMREANIRDVEEYHNLHPSFKKWAEEKKWECIEHVIPPIKHYMDLDGLVHVYRVL